MNLKTLLLISLAALLLCLTRAAADPVQFVEDTPYPQKWVTKYNEQNGLPKTGASRIIAFGDSVFALTDRGVFTLNNESWHLLETPPEIGRAHNFNSGNYGLIIASDKGAFVMPPDPSAQVELVYEGAAVDCVMAWRYGIWYVATPSGLVQISNGESTTLLPGENIIAVDTGGDGGIRAASEHGLYIIDPARGGDPVDYFAAAPVPPQTDRPQSIRDMFVDVDDEGVETIYLATGRGIVKADPAGGWELLNGETAGLAYEDVTSVAARGGVLAAGFTIGAWRRDAQGRHYFQSGRWLPDDHVLDVAIDDTGAAWFATPRGVSKIEYRMMTLAEKAAIYESTLHQRHNRHDLIGDSPLRTPGDFSTVYQKTHDNENVWTGMYVAAACFRYKVTGEAQALEHARASMNALLFLETVTGVPGYFARSFALPGEDTGSGGEWHPTPDGKYLWKSDTSSDEVVGRFFGLSTYYDLCADDAEKQLIRGSVSRTMDYIIDNDYYLIDVDGEPTHWGRWNPDFFKTDGKFQKYLNSLEILSFLRTAHHMTGHEKYYEEYKKLIREYGYAKYALTATSNQPGMHNHSDDLLAFLSYYPLLKYETSDTLKEKYFYKSIRRAARLIHDTRNPNWNFIYGAVMPPGEDFDPGGAVWTLRRMPMDLIYWEVKNSHRTDIDISPYQGMRANDARSVTPLAPDERFMLKFNENPYRLDGYWKAENSEPATFWLLPYWMGRYHGFIRQPAGS